MDLYENISLLEKEAETVEVPKTHPQLLLEAYRDFEQGKSTPYDDIFANTAVVMFYTTPVERDPSLQIDYEGDLVRISSQPDHFVRLKYEDLEGFDRVEENALLRFYNDLSQEDQGVFWEQYQGVEFKRARHELSKELSTREFLELEGIL